MQLVSKKGLFDLFPYIGRNSIEVWIAQRKVNGLSKHVHKINQRILLIDVEGFVTWLKNWDDDGNNTNPIEE